MQSEAPIVIHVRRHFDATAEQVFDAWLDPRSAGRWLFATPDGKMIRVEIDPHVGGRFAIVEDRDGEEAGHFGEYLELDRPHRLVFTFSGTEDLSDATDVTVDIEDDADGCTLALTHAMAPEWAEYVDRTREGWNFVLDSLADHLTGSRLR